ncbi:MULTISPECIES: hypothetical protein [Burkholderiaceae]|nr:MULTISPECIES: hypothetical protein [Burkholderiaceae]
MMIEIGVMDRNAAQPAAEKRAADGIPLGATPILKCPRPNSASRAGF